MGDLITELGNPAKPEGEAGKAMLSRMNDSHFEVTGWALGLWTLNPNDVVLDIGCGGGMTLKRVSDSLNDGVLFGIDYSDVSVQMSSELNKTDVMSGKVMISKGNVENLPFEDDKFDKIITVESFYFWPDPIENLKEVRRVLKPKGHFLLVADIYENGLLSEHELENVKKYSLNNPTKEEFEEYFRKSGFSETEIHTKSGTNWICVEGIK